MVAIVPVTVRCIYRSCLCGRLSARHRARVQTGEVALDHERYGVRATETRLHTVFHTYLCRRFSRLSSFSSLVNATGP